MGTVQQETDPEKIGLTNFIPSKETKLTTADSSTSHAK